MKTSDPNILKEFLTVVNRKQLTQERYEELLRRWDLHNIDLHNEMNLINQKKSSLSRSRRDAVPEFLKMEQLLSELKNKEAHEMNMTMNESQDLASDTLTV